MLGHNESPLVAIRELYEQVKTEKRPERLMQLIRDLRKAGKTANEARREEATEFEIGKAAVQAKFNPYIQPKRGMVDMAIAVANEVVGPWLLEQKQLKDERDDRQAREAAEAHMDAVDAIRASSGDLEARAEAENRLADAKEALAISVRSLKTNVAKGARSKWDVELVDLTVAARYFWAARQQEFEGILIDFARNEVLSGKREIPGFVITERITV